MKCPHCQKEFKANQNLGAHLKKYHQTTYEMYLRSITIPWPKCKCGCGQDVPLQNHGTVISEYVHGHNLDHSFDHQSIAGIAGGHACLGIKHTLEHNDAISKGVVKNYQDFGGPWQAGRFWSEKNQASFVYRSSWERIFMEQLEKDDDVQSYRYEPFTISYEYNGMMKRYLPDFLIRYKNGDREIVEVGQKDMKQKGPDLAKIEAARAFCKEKEWMFRVLDESYFRN